MGRIRNLIEPLSLGVVLILGMLWVYVNNPLWRPQVIVMMVFTALLFAFGTVRTEKALFRISFIKAIPKLLISSAITLIILISFGLIIKGEGISTIASALISVPTATILIHAFIIAFPEEIGFRGWLSDQLRSRGMRKFNVMIFTSFVFALFHFFMAGGVWLLLLPYFALGIIFFKIKERYSPETNMANTGAHFGWNLYILAFVQRIGI
jgi:membrane protease YdiL (CAAX protease family)